MPGQFILVVTLKCLLGEDGFLPLETSVLGIKANTVGQPQEVVDEFLSGRFPRGYWDPALAH